MEWIREHVGWLIPVFSTLAAAFAWLLRLEGRVANNTKATERLEERITDHASDTSKHANGKAVEKLEQKIDKFSDELVDTRKSLEISIHDTSKELRDQIANLFDKLYDQKR